MAQTLQSTGISQLTKMPTEKRRKSQLQKGREKVAKTNSSITNFFGNRNLNKTTVPGMESLSTVSDSHTDSVADTGKECLDIR